MNNFIICFTLLFMLNCSQELQTSKSKSSNNSIVKIVDVDLSQNVETSLTFNPNHDLLYFAKKDSFYVSGKSTIYTSRKVNGLWQKPSIASFSGVYSENNPFITPDGERLYYTSNRPVKPGIEKKDKDIWYLEKTSNSWSDPKHIRTYNSSKSEYSPTLDNDKNLYFGSYREGGKGWGDLWVSYYKDGSYQEPENLGYSINTSGGEWGSCISPNGDFIIFEASGRKENLSNDGDLYISFKENNYWQPAIHIRDINSTASDLTPKIHGKYLYFASNRHPNRRIEINNNNVDLYQIELKAIWNYLDKINPKN